MAKYLLWFIVILGFLALIISHSSGEDIGLFPRIVIFSCLGVLAICESIQKLNKQN